MNNTNKYNLDKNCEATILLKKVKSNYHLTKFVRNQEIYPNW